MITDSDINSEVSKLNDVAKPYERNYQYIKGKDVLGLFDVHDNIYKPVYASKTNEGLFAYVSLLKNIYLKGEKSAE